MFKLFATRLTFWTSLIGVAMALTLVVQTSIPQGIPEPLVEPPLKPAGTRLVGSGIVESFGDNVRVSSMMSGVVSDIYCRVGDRLEKGDKLFRLDSRLAEMDLEIAERGLIVAKAEHERLKKVVDRLIAVGDKRAVSEGELESRRSELEVTNAKIETAASMVKQAETRLRLQTVTSPENATVLQVNVRPGEFTAPGSSPPPVLIGNTEELQIRVDIDEELASYLPKAPDAVGYIRGNSKEGISLEFVRVEPLIVPKTNLSGAPGERVDTRVLQVIFKTSRSEEQPLFIGQQLEVFITNPTK